MLSFWARLLLAATQLAPLLATYTFVYYPIDRWIAIGFALVAVVLCVLCRVILHFAVKDIQEEPLRIKSVRTADPHVLAYIVGYLYPLVYAQVTTVRLSVLVFVFVVLLLVLYTSKAFNINPVLQMLFRYKFYEVVTRGDFTYVVVSKRKIVNTRTPIDGRQLSPYMYLDAEG